MKVIHLNTGVNQTSAPYKLHEALLQVGVESEILVLNEGDSLSNVRKVPKNFFYKFKRKCYAFLRKAVMKGYHLTDYMPFTALPIGMDISRLPCVKAADVLLLHWVCGDYMSPRTVRKLLNSGKRVFWVCHDNFPFTGGCHVRLGCDRYKKGCGLCPQLHSTKSRDISRKLIEKKISLLKYSEICIISPSSWMDYNVEKSAVFGGHQHFILPNAINTELFFPYDKECARREFNMDKESFYILSGIKVNEKIPYNGTEFLWEVFHILYEKCVDGKWQGRKVKIVMFGSENINIQCDFPIFNIGYVHEPQKLAHLYSASDVFVVTSLEDSFNQTVAECMACGTPVAAFRNGGIEDIIDHKKNGYLAQYKNAMDLAEGVLWTSSIGYDDKVRKKIVDCYSYDKVSSKFLQIVKSGR